MLFGQNLPGAVPRTGENPLQSSINSDVHHYEFAGYTAWYVTQRSDSWSVPEPEQSGWIPLHKEDTWTEVDRSYKNVIDTTVLKVL